MDFEQVKKDKENSVIYHVSNDSNAKFKVIVLGTHQGHQKSAKLKDPRKLVFRKDIRPVCTGS